jgi:L-alanine-DL-glutamate epimerase-like enolase superfamily enzyme
VKPGLNPDVIVSALKVSAYRIPCSSHEADGTFEWDETIMVIVHAEGGGQTGIGYSYTGLAAATVIEENLTKKVLGHDALSPRAAYDLMVQGVRNIGRDGVASSAISAVDAALWDLKARLLDVSMVDLLGAVRQTIPVYGSGGFTSYSDRQLKEQLSGWVNEGIRAVKMKIGTHPDQDVRRVRWARHAIGDEAALFVDANGAYDRKQARHKALQFADSGVSWFEEPVSSDDLEGLRLLRDRSPSGMEIAAGEYGYNMFYFRRMLEAGAVDVLQADATRCGGVTGFLNAGDLVNAWGLPLSAHTAPSLHGHLCCAVSRARNVEYFHDHVRIEAMLFDGALEARNGDLRPDRASPGFGITIRESDAERYRIHESEMRL